METTELISQLLELPRQWEVYQVNFSEKSESKNKQVHIYIRYTDDQGVCKQTGEICPVYDYRADRMNLNRKKRKWQTGL